MIQNRQKWLFGMTFFILLIISVVVILNINPKKESDLLSIRETKLPDNVVSSSSAETGTGESINQTGQNGANGETVTKASGIDDPYFNKLVESDVLDASFNMILKGDINSTLDSLKATDKEINHRFDLPDDILSQTSTDKLFSHYTTSPMKGMIMIYAGENEWIGVQRLLNSSSTLYEFYMREDLAEGVLKMYREYDFSPQSMSDNDIRESLLQGEHNLNNPTLIKSLEPNNIINMKIAYICINIYFADKTLLSPQFFPKLKGHEKEFLQVMIDRYDIISKLEETYGGPEESRYGAAMSGVPTFCLGFAENIEKDLYNKLKEIGFAGQEGQKQFINEIKQYLKDGVK
jgi:hypothetical protein